MNPAAETNTPRAEVDAAGLLRALEVERSTRGLSKAELARRSQLPPETVRRLLTGGEGNPTLETVLNMLRPLRLGLLFVALPDAVEAAPADPEMLRLWLVHYGAPLYGTTAAEGQPVPRPEYVLAEALKLAREDASVARALPLALWRTRKRLEMAELRRLAVERAQERTLGFFLELTAELGGDESLKRAARPLRLRGQRRRASQFFKVRSRLERQLAEMKTPPLARRWGFRMNMGQDSFESMFRKGSGLG